MSDYPIAVKVLRNIAIDRNGKTMQIKRDDQRFAIEEREASEQGRKAKAIPAVMLTEEEYDWYNERGAVKKAKSADKPKARPKASKNVQPKDS